MDVLKSHNKTLWVGILWLLAQIYWLNAVGNYVFVPRKKKNTQLWMGQLSNVQSLSEVMFFFSIPPACLLFLQWEKLCSEL